MSLSSVLTMGFKPTGNVFLVTTMGYGQGGVAPTPPTPPDVIQQFFGGGPFTKRYGYGSRHYRQDEDLYEKAKEARDELSGSQAEKIEEAIFEAVEAVTEQSRGQFLKAQAVYDRVFASVKRDLRTELWRAEIERRIHEDEEDQIELLLIEGL